MAASMFCNVKREKNPAHCPNLQQDFFYYCDVSVLDLFQRFEKGAGFFSLFIVHVAVQRTCPLKRCAEFSPQCSVISQHIN